MEKKIVYVDLDGVMVDLESHAINRHGPKAIEKLGMLTSVDKELFLDPPAIEGAIEAIHRLSEKYEVFFLSTAPWSNVNAWSHKRIWVQKNLGKFAHKRLILSHRKDLLMGDYLIDDRTKNGAGEFKGQHIHFGQEGFENWEKVLAYLEA
jgi:5'(3')-deoxyribonucleotidase